MEFFATCPKGFEGLLADELGSLRIPQVRPLRGQVSFGGELADAYRACLWSRLASRVLLVLARSAPRTADTLYEGLCGIDWTRHLAPGATFAVDAHGTNASLRNTQFVALRSKDAISDVVFHARQARPMTDTNRPDVTVAVRVSGERAVVAIDLSGEPLFHRGYDSRAARDVAPLRPDYATATRRWPPSGRARAASWWRPPARRSTARRGCCVPAGASRAGRAMTPPPGRRFSTRPTGGPRRASGTR